MITDYLNTEQVYNLITCKFNFLNVTLGKMDIFLSNMTKMQTHNKGKCTFCG